MSKNNEIKVQDTLKSTRGVAEHKGSLRIQFRLPGDMNSTRKTLSLKPTIHNIKVAANKLGAIKIDIQNGFYDNNPKEFWRRHFPSDVKHIIENKTISDYYEHFLKVREDELSDSVQSKLKSTKSWLIKHKLFESNIIELLPSQIEKALKTSYKDLKQSTVDEYMMYFKRIVQEAIIDETLLICPFSKTRKIKADKMLNEDKDPTPFSQTELTALLSVVHVEQTKEMIQLLAWTGMRPGEMKALAWEDIDLEKGIVSIKYNIDRKGKLKPPKTLASVRKIELLPKALEVIKRQLALTDKKPILLETVHYKYGRTKLVMRHRVFLSRADLPYKRPELVTAPKQWQKWLVAANLSHRPPYQLRHTFASQLLMVGADITWLANQMGHADWGDDQENIRKVDSKRKTRLSK